MSNGQCPKCNVPISSVTLERITIKGKETNWKGVSYLCPSCNCVLSVSIDPVALKAEILQALEDLRKG
jgi:hypothetical protein